MKAGGLVGVVQLQGVGAQRVEEGGVDTVESPASAQTLHQRAASVKSIRPARGEAGSSARPRGGDAQVIAEQEPGALTGLRRAGLRSGHGSQGGHLDHMRRAGGALALQLGHGIDDGRGSQRVSQPPAGHGVGL